MRTVNEYRELQVPCWALSYLVNGDDSGINAADKAQVDRWFAHFEEEAREAGGSVIFAPREGEGSFTHRPEFGLACDCVDSTVLIVVSESETCPSCGKSKRVGDSFPHGCVVEAVGGAR